MKKHEAGRRKGNGKYPLYASSVRKVTIRLSTGGSVEAHAVGGEEGVFATRVTSHVYQWEGQEISEPLVELYAGDDGSWRLIGTYSKSWLSAIIVSLQRAQQD